MWYFLLLIVDLLLEVDEYIRLYVLIHPIFVPNHVKIQNILLWMNFSFSHTFSSVSATISFNSRIRSLILDRYRFSMALCDDFRRTRPPCPKLILVPV